MTAISTVCEVGLGANGKREEMCVDSVRKSKAALLGVVSFFEKVKRLFLPAGCFHRAAPPVPPV